MAKFTKTLASLNTQQLLAAMADFHLAPPPAYTVSTLKALVKAHMSVNPQLMGNPDYAPLFTKRARDAYRARSPTPPSWNGINPGSGSRSRSASPEVSSPAPRASSSPEPRDLEQAARLQLLQSFSPAVLDRAIEHAMGLGESSFLYCILISFSLRLRSPISTSF
ncbi:hypothetical protein FB451DRAFT_1272745 [Mycena latifolia]|nr:hypothetical protein FB451DRAFT_1272745 [Mycena latifolia]